MANRVQSRLGGHTWIIPVAATAAAFAFNRFLGRRSTARSITSSIGIGMAVAGLFAAEPVIEEIAETAQVPAI